MAQSAGLLSYRGLLLLLLCVLIAGSILPVGCTKQESPPNIVWRDLTLTPSEVGVGEEVLIEFWVDIRPDRGVTTDVTLRIDDEDIQTKLMHAEGNAITKVWFRVTAKTVGTHKVSIHNLGIDKLTGTLVVTEPEQT